MRPLSEISDPVRRQYETFPYPARDPRDESKRLIEGSPSHILEIDHYLFGGRRDFRRPLRALFAGGGTGDGTIMLAQQLADRACPAELVYLDLSSAARRIAEERAAARGLTAIRFITGSIEDLPALGLGRFDYIDCCGVLHHLADPAAGLAALVEALADDGGMGLMLYGAIGRTGVYHVQEMLRKVAPAGRESEAVRLGLARRLIGQLPSTNWFARNPAVGDHLRGGDAGLHDLLLHSRDRAFTVPEIVALTAAAGLAIVAFIEPWRYSPASYLSDAALLRRVQPLGLLERAAFAELLAGNLKSHIVYVVKRGREDTTARPDGSGAVPVLRHADGPALAAGSKPAGRLTARIDGIEIRFPLPRLAGPILARIDGRRSLAEIHAALAEGGRVDWPAFKAEFDRLYAVFHGLNRMFIRAPPTSGTGT